MMGEKNTALLLINLGTPQSPTTKDVRVYLREFLMDRRVLTLGAVARWALVNLAILPSRPKHSAEAYRQIWTELGSPLLLGSQAVCAGIESAVEGNPSSSHVKVELAMRYGEPSIKGALENFRQDGVDRIIVLPLYPQYASSSTGSAVEEVLLQASKLWALPSIHVVPPFYDDPGYIDSVAGVAQDALRGFDYDHFLMTFHSIPESHVQDTDPSHSHCLASADCCARIGKNNRLCFRAHCMHTAHALAQRLDLADDAWSVSFQSRLTKEPWLTPSTEAHLEALAQRGIKRLAIISPAFIADCLETLEELGIRGKEIFLGAGGDDYRLVPCVNGDTRFTDAAVALAARSGWLQNTPTAPS